MVNRKKQPIYTALILLIGALVLYFFTCNNPPKKAADFRTKLIAFVKQDSLEEIKALDAQYPDSMKTCLNNMGSTILRNAAMAGSLHTVEYLLTQKSLDINAEEGAALHYAASMGRTEMVQFLLKKGAAILPNGYSRENPLHAAAGTNPDLWVEREDKDFTKIDIPGVVKILIEHGIDVNSLDKDNETPLHRAAFVQNYAVVKYLLEQKAAVNSRDKSGNTPLHDATFTNKNNSVCALLLSYGANPSIKNTKGNTPLLYGYADADTSTIHLFEQYGYDPVNDVNNEGKTLLHGALGNNQYATIDYLLQQKADVNATTAQGMTPFHLAAAMRGPKGLAVIQKLMAAGANINAKDTWGRTPLSYVDKVIETDHGTFYPDSLIVSYLIKHGARPPNPLGR
ncbi:MAG: ankyrin repeat domain-containing protein [Chitinophagales bacterium]|nr:ankyrin repeat domain-containing protein [Chitinophagales bacterium]